MNDKENAPTILIVDDDEMMLQMAETILHKYTKYRTLRANSGLQCIDRVQQEKIDLILLDIQMPGMNGLKTLELIRKREDGKNLPVIFLTASSDRDTVVKAGLLKAANYIKKPFLPQDLVDRVNNVLANKLLSDPAITGVLDNLDALMPQGGAK
ncbi:MAG: response regulator [Selenomonadaceae bacterium]|nr:response regulator [Selenomonadaceae bacterium]